MRGRSGDKSQIRSMLNESRLEIGEAVMLKIVSGGAIQDPALGMGRTYTFTLTPTRAIIEQVEQNDVLNSGGLYQLGDINVQLNELLREVVDKVGNIGDRLVWRNSEYRVVGKRQPETLIGQAFIYSYTMRKVDEV